MRGMHLTTRGRRKLVPEPIGVNLSNHSLSSLLLVSLDLPNKVSL